MFPSRRSSLGCRETLRLEPQHPCFDMHPNTPTLHHLSRGFWSTEPRHQRAIDVTEAHPTPSKRPVAVSAWMHGSRRPGLAARVSVKKYIRGYSLTAEASVRPILYVRCTPNYQTARHRHCSYLASTRSNTLEPWQFWL